MKRNLDTIDHVLNIIQWKDCLRDGEDVYVAQQRSIVVTRDGLGVGYTVVRVEPTEWVAPLYKGKPILTNNGMIVYERIKR